MNKAIEPARTLKFTASAPLGLWEFDYVYMNSRQFTLRGYFPIDSINYSLEAGEFKADITLRIVQKQVDQGYNYYEGARSKYNALPGAGNKHSNHEIWY